MSIVFIPFPGGSNFASIEEWGVQFNDDTSFKANILHRT